MVKETKKENKQVDEMERLALKAISLEMLSLSEKFKENCIYVNDVEVLQLISNLQTAMIDLQMDILKYIRERKGVER